MSWLFSQALVEEYSAGSCSDGEPSVQLSVMPTPQLFWRNDKMTDYSIFSRFGLTSQLLTANRGAELLTLFLAAFPARTSQSPEKGPASMESEADYGEKCGGSFAKYDPNSSTWKTPQRSLFGGFTEFSETWPRWGTMRNGVCWRRPMWERRTKGKGYGYWRTPAAHEPGVLAERLIPIDGGTPGGMNRHFDKQTGRMAQIGLSQQVSLRQTWPTPTACEWKGRGPNSKQQGLAEKVKKWPTPTVNDAKNATLPPSQIKHDNIPGALLRTGQKAGGQLNPTWVEWLMGWPLGWTDLKPSATGRCRCAWQKRGAD
jgi:hypothetical protein